MSKTTQKQSIQMKCIGCGHKILLTLHEKTECEVCATLHYWESETRLIELDN